MEDLFRETGMIQANSDMLLGYAWVGTGRPQDRVDVVADYLHVVPDYFKQLYISDLKKHNPPVFVDAVAPEGFAFTDRALFGYETFPALAQYIDEHYQLQAEINGIRIFVRKDRLAGNGA